MYVLISFFFVADNKFKKKYIKIKICKVFKMTIKKYVKINFCFNETRKHVVIAK